MLQMKKSNHPEVETSTVKIKISGDGARMSHSSSLLVFSFSILDQVQHVLSSTGTVKLFSQIRSREFDEIVGLQCDNHGFLCRYRQPNHCCDQNIRGLWQPKSCDKYSKRAD